MNKFLTYPGKQPVYLGDINYLQSSVRDALQNLMKAYTGRADANAIIYGVEITYALNSISWTAGVVCLAGEILPIEAGILTSGSTYYFDIVSVAGGQRTFGDGEVRSCWEDRAATITSTATDYPLAGIRRVFPVDAASAKVHDFDGVANLDDRYARLANCGGAFILSVRRPGPVESSESNIFQGDVSDMTDGELAKFSASNAPARMLALAIIDTTGDTLPVVIQWSIVSGKIHFEISKGASAIEHPYEIQVTLPVF